MRIEIVNGKWFTHTSVILILNKYDLFRRRLKEGVSMNICFGEDAIKTGMEVAGIAGGFFRDNSKPTYWDVANDYHPSKKEPITTSSNASDDADGDEEFEKCVNIALEFIKDRFAEMVTAENRIIDYTHVLTAVDIKNVEEMTIKICEQLVERNEALGNML